MLLTNNPNSESKEQHTILQIIFGFFPKLTSICASICPQQKWKRYWLALHPASPQSVARLELSEAVHAQRSTVVKRHPEKKKVIRLSDCVSVFKLPPHAEACPRDNMAAFCVETEDKKLVFAAERQSCGEWVEIICNIAFQVRF